MLDIVITHYTEPWEVCRRLLETLDAQRGVDWEQVRVTIVNDGGFRLPKDKLYCLNIVPQQKDIPHSGISAARNAGIRLAQEPWIMFCDCDDCFSNVFALADILNVLNDPETEQRYDMMWTKVWAEDLEKNQVYQIQDIKIMVFIHGKVYRREFLLKNGIWFDERLTFNEDSAFNAMIRSRIPDSRIGEISMFAPAYVWISREGSVTQKEGADDQAAVGQMLRNILVADDYKIHKPQEFSGMVTRVTYDAFFMAHSRRLTPSCKQKVMEVFLPWVKDCIGLFASVDAKMLRRIRMISRSELTELDEEICDEPGNVRAWVEWELSR